jgi:hypothetical protein
MTTSRTNPSPFSPVPADGLAPDPQRRLEGLAATRASLYLEEGRLLLLELMGDLACPPATPEARNAPAPSHRGEKRGIP